MGRSKPRGEEDSSSERRRGKAAQEKRGSSKKKESLDKSEDLFETGGAEAKTSNVRKKGLITGGSPLEMVEVLEKRREED